MPQGFSFSGDAVISIESLLVSLGIGAVLALIVRWHFMRFSSTLSNREEFAQVFPFILLTTILIISVVKSSLALSLGLVGALSIVRFRTPIKEPEELAYLFISIAIGLGLGAEQTLATCVAAPVILTIVGMIKWTRREKSTRNLYVSIDWQGQSDQVPDRFIEQLNTIIAKHAAACDLKRFDIRNGSIEATYFLDIASSDNLSALTEELRRSIPAAGVTFLDQSRLPNF